MISKYENLQIFFYKLYVLFTCVCVCVCVLVMLIYSNFIFINFYLTKFFYDHFKIIPRVIAATKRLLCYGETLILNYNLTV